MSPSPGAGAPRCQDYVKAVGLPDSKDCVVSGPLHVHVIGVTRDGGGWVTAPDEPRGHLHWLSIGCLAFRTGWTRVWPGRASNGHMARLGCGTQLDRCSPSYVFRPTMFVARSCNALPRRDSLRRTGSDAPAALSRLSLSLSVHHDGLLGQPAAQSPQPSVPPVHRRSGSLRPVER
jgi:hypothetical protein